MPSRATDTVYVCNCMCHYPAGWRWDPAQPLQRPKVLVPCQECDMVMHGPWDERPWNTGAVDSPPMTMPTPGSVQRHLSNLPTPSMSTEEVLWQAFRMAYHQDHANAAMHCAPVRYSPITFRLAEQINDFTPVDQDVYSEVYSVLLDRGEYPEDAGR